MGYLRAHGWGLLIRSLEASAHIIRAAAGAHVDSYYH